MNERQHNLSRQGDASASLLRSTAGFTLVEIMIVLGIVATLVASTMNAIPSFSATERMRADAVRLNNAIRFAYLQAAAEGLYYRLAFNLDERTFVVEYSDAPFYVIREGDEKEALRIRKEQEKISTESLFEEDESEGAEEGADTEAPPSDAEETPPAPSGFAALEDEIMVKRTLDDDVRFHSYYAMHHKEAVHEGAAYLYFFPRGQTEFAIITLTTAAQDEDSDAAAESAMSLIVNPLTGAVEIREGLADPEEIREELTKE